MGEVMNSLDKAMQLMLQEKRNQLWKLSARMDNAMIEAFESKGLKANDYMEIDKYSGFGNMRLKPGVEDELSWENQVKQAKANCLHLHTTVHEYVKIKTAESKEEKKNSRVCVTCSMYVCGWVGGGGGFRPVRGRRPLDLFRQPD